MTKLLTLPFKGMKVSSITQFYNDGHKALDIVKGGSIESYGTPLCAPEDAKVIGMTEGTFTPGDTGELEHGYGIFLKGLETGYSYLFWHTLPIMPVYLGDNIQRGSIVAFMGNAGLVFRGGVYVPVKDRLGVDKLGTHLHMEMFDKGYVYGKKKRFIDPLPHLGWALQPDYTNNDLKEAQLMVLQKVKELIS